ncbi:AraC family transcriptional regulator [Chitinophaga tropicalis]|uniref:Helix-turn-helix domain-containing protein n=1 Tax=Chitinophaga tropicalis TaxID=2683588 RepID=A0A7K1UCQ8_9BACT|nr:AraC family transcriptional regulator [Chitinophaga tropicalis]MVT12159.1 helix-turn-helix domain-containing protein [Chitinophaga tropicalis]
MANVLKQFFTKKIGYLDFDHTSSEEAMNEEYNSLIKIIFLEAGSEITVDFNTYQLKQPALFFVNIGQWYKLSGTGTLLYYNRDFYCIQIHDKEVACDGILYNNVYDIPVVHLDEEAAAITRRTLSEIKKEATQDDSGMEEMLRILLKQIIIRSTRIWKKVHEPGDKNEPQDMEFIRKFSQLVEAHYTQHHNVADYAAMLNITPKALGKRISKHSTISPNDIIKNRIILEAKRLLIHTDLTVKEIGYKLGYDDPAYFVRLFTNQTDTSPLLFRKQSATGEKVQ